jgi:hypothetical protein
MGGVHPTVRKLFILGALLTVAAEVILFVSSFGFGLWQGFSLSRSLGSHHPIDPHQMATHQLALIFPLSIFCMVMRFAGFVFLASGLIRYSFRSGRQMPENQILGAR